LLRQRLYRLSLALSTLDDAAFRFVQVDEAADLHLAPLGAAFIGRIFALRNPSEDGLSLFAHLLRRQSTISPDGDKSLGSRATAPSARYRTIKVFAPLFSTRMLQF